MSLRVTGMPTDLTVSSLHLVRAYPAKDRASRVANGHLPFPEDLPLRPLDDVEFESRESLEHRRGILHVVYDDRRCLVIVPPKTGRAARVWRPHVSEIRRVWRDGEEVAKL